MPNATRLWTRRRQPGSKGNQAKAELKPRQRRQGWQSRPPPENFGPSGGARRPARGRREFLLRDSMPHTLVPVNFSRILLLLALACRGSGRALEAGCSGCPPVGIRRLRRNPANQPRPEAAQRGKEVQEEQDNVFRLEAGGQVDGEDAHLSLNTTANIFEDSTSPSSSLASEFRFSAGCQSFSHIALRRCAATSSSPARRPRRPTPG